MNQKALLIIVGIIVVILLGMWAVGAERADAPVDGATTTPAENTEELNTTLSPNGNIAADISDGTYELDTNESIILWTGHKPRVLGYEDTGTVKLESGSLMVEGGMITSGDFTVDMETIDVSSTGNDKPGEMLEEHLSSEDFFAVEQYPDARFVLTSVDGGMITGDLTIKSTTKSITFPATIMATSDTQLNAEADLVLDRAAWDVRYGSGSFFDDLGDNIIADDINFHLSLVLKK